MSEPRFFVRLGPFLVSEVARMADAELRAGEYGDRDIYDISSMEEAAAGDLTFFNDVKFKQTLELTQAGAVLVSQQFSDLVPSTTSALIVTDPRRAFAAVAAQFYPQSMRTDGIFGGDLGISDNARVHPSANLEEGVRIEPGAVVGSNAQIGQGSVICANAVIGAGVSIGRKCSIGPGAVLVHAMLGDNVIVHAGAKIGQDGFGYAMSAEGHLKVPQIGRVIIQRDVEIGANTTVDRGALGDTIIGEGCKIDNLVQIGHNVVFGRHCVVAALAGISGSVVVEDFVLIGGSAGISDHVRLGAGAQIASFSAVKSDVLAGEKYAGVPAKPLREFARELYALKKLAKRKGLKGGRESDE